MDAAHPLVLASSWTFAHVLQLVAFAVASTAAWYARRRWESRRT